jgi:kynurenine formamidase
MTQRHDMGRILLGTLLCLGLCAQARGQSLDLAAARIVDLTHSFDQSTIYWPTSPSGFELKRLQYGKTAGGFFYSANSFCSPEHGGTHLDAPLHFAEGHWTNADIPVERFVGPAVVIDIGDKAAADPDYTLKPEDVTAWEERNGRIAEGAIVLLRTGWSKRWPDRKAYLGDDTPGDASHLHFPAYGAEAASLLVNERRARLLGVDTASVDNGPSKEFLVHRVIAAANASGLENLTNLDALPANGAMVIALPMKIAFGSGGPARVIALLGH